MSGNEKVFPNNKLRLFEHGQKHAFVQLHSIDDVEVLFSSFSYLKIGKLYLLENIVHENDFDRIRGHYKNVNKSIVGTEFCLKDGTKIFCSSQQVDEGTSSIWKVKDMDNPIALLQAAAHDIRSPINSILGMAGLIQQLVKDGEKDDEEFGSILEMIKKSCFQATDLTEDILELAKIESKGYQLQTRTVVMSDFLSEYINTHRLLTLKKKIDVQLESDTDAKAKINESNVTRVLDNLMTNAVKFSPTGSTIRIGLEANEQFIQVKITDSGVGMPEQLISQLFVKFGKSQRRGLDGEVSHGLGMSIVKQIMDLHLGEVLVESEEGKGTDVMLNFKKI
ncbi:MAG: HAMP domain-containing histidine kinase [Cytophagales bacterium]|nr:HAMP domain-containing histidine kinase [Cytophagales bacterium]